MLIKTQWLCMTGFVAVSLWFASTLLVPSLARSEPCSETTGSECEGGSPDERCDDPLTPEIEPCDDGIDGTFPTVPTADLSVCYDADVNAAHCGSKPIRDLSTADLHNLFNCLNFPV